MHPRDSDGRETLDPDVVNAVVAQVREACGVPVGVSTGAWIEPDLERRIECVSAWREPDYASVNLSEAGSSRVMEALANAGIGIEAAVWNPADAERLAASGFGDRAVRILLEPLELTAADAVERVDAVHEALDRLGLTAVPRLQHGADEATWVLIPECARRGLDTRVGFEDTLTGPNGEPAESNEALVRAARAMLDEYGAAP